MPKAGNRRKKTRTHVVDNEGAQSALASNANLKVPKSLIIRRGKVEAEISELIGDLRKVMLPYTALNFKEDPKNRKHTLSTYSKHLAMPMGVSHILALSQNAQNVNLRLARVPEGPTMTFRITKFSLVKHVRAIQRRPYTCSGTSGGIHQHPPIVVTNNFGDATAPPHIKLMRITFQNMFPAINVATVKLHECRRVVLFNLINESKEDENNDSDDKDHHVVEMRHYVIKATPVGVDRKVRRLVVQSKIPNLSNLNDIADYITGTTASGLSAPAAVSQAGAVSDSENEDEAAHVVLPQKYSGRGNNKSQKSSLKLVELGPRLSMKLLKVERGLGQGDVMYHALIQKTVEEVRELKQRKEAQELLRQQRRLEQEANVERKRKAKESKLEAKRQRKESREQGIMDELRKGAQTHDDDDDDDDDDDVEIDGKQDSSDEAKDAFYNVEQEDDDGELDDTGSDEDLEDDED